MAAAAQPLMALLMVYTVRVTGGAVVQVAALDTPTGRGAARRAALERSGQWDPAAFVAGRVKAVVLRSRVYDARRDAHLLTTAATEARR